MARGSHSALSRGPHRPRWSDAALRDLRALRGGAWFTRVREREPMSHGHPTIQELESCVHKGSHREIGNWLARRIARPTAVYGTWIAVRLGLSAHQVTLAALLSSLAGAAAIGLGSRLGFVLGVAGLHLGFWLDHVDGQVARWRRTVSLDGVYLDYLMHHVVNLAVGFALGYGLAMRSGNPLWAVAVFAIAA